MLLAALVLQVPPIPPVPYCTPSPACVGTSTGTFYGVHTLCVAATNHVEKYLIEGPTATPDGTPKPMVVLFHGFGGDHASVAGTNFWSAAKQAGYLVIAHDGGWDAHCVAMGHKTYGSEEFHHATRAVMADVLAQFPNDVDTDRVYAYGFSMGGGNALNYAARHQDPAASDDVMFAAVVNHSGAVSVPLQYFDDNLAPSCAGSISCTGNAVQTFFDTQYGNTYCTNDFVFQRATVLDWKDTLLPVLLATSLARDLHAVPIQTHYDTQNCFLAQGCVKLHEVLLGSGNHSLTLLGTIHGWDQLSPSTVLSFFSGEDLPNTLSSASVGYAMIAENDTRHFFFEGQRTIAGDFGRLIWGFPPGGNRVNLINVAQENLDKVTLIVDRWTTQLDVSSCLQVDHDDPFLLTVRGYMTSPLAVTLDNNPVSWFFDSGAHEVNILDPTPGVIQITPAGGSCP